jgi:RHS repeat-associated protein
VAGTLDMQYAYSPTNNNGKIMSQTDVLSGEQITYTYDSLNRLATAQTADNPSVTQWGQSYTYDGFGNLTDQNGIKGTVPTMHVVYNASTNRQTTDTADANGNIGSGYIYDIENRLLQAGSGMPQYGYDAGNKRIWRTTGDEFTFWSGNQKWATYSIAVSGSTMYFTLTGTNVYFGGRMIAKGTYNSGGSNDKVTLSAIATDRLGSVVNNGVNKFYPYGQERPGATTNDKEKFTGYFRDAATGLDYADQRYHQPGVGRFMTPDAYAGSALTISPGSWNRYAYALGDPINGFDRKGTTTCWDLAADYEEGCDQGGGGFDTIPDGTPPDGLDPLGNPVFIQDAHCGCDVPLEDLPQTVFSLINQANPEGFINFAGSIIAGLGTAGAGVSIAIDAVSTATLASATIATGSTTTLYRAVEPQELVSIQQNLQSGVQSFTNIVGIESKYFSDSMAGAASYAQQAFQNFGFGPYTIVQTSIPTAAINPAINVTTVDHGISTINLLTSQLQLLDPAVVLPFSPLP